MIDFFLVLVLTNLISSDGNRKVLIFFNHSALTRWHLRAIEFCRQLNLITYFLRNLFNVREPMGLHVVVRETALSIRYIFLDVLSHLYFRTFVVEIIDGRIRLFIILFLKCGLILKVPLLIEHIN
jgi:hypothetical protein